VTLVLIRGDDESRQLVLKGKHVCGLFLLAAGESEAAWHAFFAINREILPGFFETPKQMRTHYASLTMFEDRMKRCVKVLREMVEFKFAGAGRLIYDVERLYLPLSPLVG
jgi:hypothetical protein